MSRMTEMSHAMHDFCEENYSPEDERDIAPKVEQPPVVDHLHHAIMKVFNEGFERDLAEAAKIREEIKRRGTYWAGNEIWDLRRAVASLRKRIAEQESKNGND
jgi:hypothetical protein